MDEHPMTRAQRLWALFFSTLYISAFTFGGGYVIVTFMKRKFVDELHWIDEQEMLDMTALAQSSPGAIAVNAATFVGVRIAGIPGALVATLGCIAPALVLVSLLAWVYNKYKNLSVLQNVLACLRPVVVALILGAGLSVLVLVVLDGAPLRAENIQWIDTGLFVAALVILRKAKWDPILTMCLCGAAGLVLHLVLPVA